MNTAIAVCTCILMGYLIGSINLSHLISKSKGYDIREHGSRNAGASGSDDFVWLFSTKGPFDPHTYHLESC